MHPINVNCIICMSHLNCIRKKWNTNDISRHLSNWLHLKCQISYCFVHFIFAHASHFICKLHIRPTSNLSNQMLQCNSNELQLVQHYASGQDPQFVRNFARAVHFDIGRMRPRNDNCRHQSVGRARTGMAFLHMRAIRNLMCTK